MKIILDMRLSETPSETQEYLKDALGFPDYYGKNLDALYDMLTTWTVPAVFCLRLPMSEKMKEYASRLQRVFTDASLHNRNLRVTVR